MSYKCLNQSRSNYVADIIESIPDFSEIPKPISSLCAVYHKKNSMCKFCLKTVIVFLKIFDAISIVSENCDSEIRIKAKTQPSFWLLKSLALYIRKGGTFIPNWNEKIGIGESCIPSLILRSGSQLVYQMEYRRIQELNDKTPIRFVKVSQAIIKAKIRGCSKPMYLVQYDEKALQFQLIGGRKDSVDLDALSVMKREINEELTQNNLVFQKDYELKKLAPELKVKYLSYTVGAYSEYHFTIYQIFYNRAQLILGQNDRWITYSELVSGRVKQGTRVHAIYIEELDIQLPGGLDSLPLSLDEVQKRPLSEIIKERRWELIGIIISVLGIIIGIVMAI